MKNFFQHQITIRDGPKREVFTKNLIYVGCCAPKSLSLEDNSIIRVLQVAKKDKKQKLGVNKGARSITTANIGVNME